MQRISILGMLAVVSASSCLLAPASMAKAPAPAKAKPAMALRGQDAEAVEREKKIKAMMKSTLKSYSSVRLTTEQQQQAEVLFGKAVKSLVTRRAQVGITDEMQKKLATCLKEVQGSTAKERTRAAFARAAFTEEQVKVYESTQKTLDKAKRDFHKGLTERQIAGLPKSLQRSIQGEKP